MSLVSEKTIVLNGQVVAYRLTVKKVKNMNARITENGLCVSVGRMHSPQQVEAFLQKNAGWVLSHLEKRALQAAREYPLVCTKEELLADAKFLGEMFAHKFGAATFQVRKMRASYGRCNVASRRITLAEGLCRAPKELRRYVIFHELTHLLVPNHSADFYQALAKVCPNWKQMRATLKREYSGILKSE